MSPEYERACMLAAGLVPISFAPPDAQESCAGRIRANGRTLGLCLTCARQGPKGIDPAARIVAGSAECINYMQAA